MSIPNPPTPPAHKARTKAVKSVRKPAIANPVASREQLAELQREMVGVLARPLTANWGMQRHDENGRPMQKVAAAFIKPNDRLTSFDRLEIYNRQYWFRLLDCLHEDYPGVVAVLGERRFMKLSKDYITKYPSRSFSLRNLGDRLERFIHEVRNEPEWKAAEVKHPDLMRIAREIAQFEWAQVVAFDDPAAPVITPDDVLDTPSSELCLGLQPYLSLLALHYAVDEFAVGIKQDEALRSEASQAYDSAPKRRKAKGRFRLPEAQKIWLAVHRFDNVVYFKRLEPEAFAILQSLRKGMPLEASCEKALIKSRRTDVDWPTQISEWFALWSRLGWLTRP